MPVSKSLRFQVLRRDGFRCHYCGATAQESELHVDHVVAVALGGTDTPENLVTACADCNRGKAATPADAETIAAVDEVAVKWAAAMQEAARRTTADRLVLESAIDDFDAAWLDWYWGGNEANKFPRPNDWRESIKKLMAAGLQNADLEDAVQIAMNSRASADKTWRYFCGVCWRKVTDLQETARDILEEGERGA